ncbi:MAG TPA: hypothetical protein PKD68_04830 [Candidatus Saccharibacteria bacterium]|nr:hypothetical protein [Candidatus Saccharibacteria bacterium]
MDKPTTSQESFLSRNGRRIAGAIAGFSLAITGCAPSSNVEAIPAPTETTATSSATPTPEASKSPETIKPVDTLHDNLEGMTSREIYPLPEQLTPDYVVAHRDKIEQLFALDKNTATKPEVYIKEVFDRVNARYSFGSDKETMDRVLDGDGTVNSERLDDWMRAWRAAYNYTAEQEPLDSAVDFFKFVFYAEQATALAEYTGTPAQPVSIALIPDMDSFEYTMNDNGTWSGQIKYREWFWSDTNATKASIGKTFSAKDSMITWKFHQCGLNKDTGKVNFGCEPPKNRTNNT